MPAQTNTSTTATTNRIKALASILSEGEHDDDDDWGEKYISRDNVRDRRNFFQNGHTTSQSTTTPSTAPSIIITHGSYSKHAANTTTMMGQERQVMKMAQSKSKLSFGEKSSVCHARAETAMESHPTAALPIENASTNSQVSMARLRTTSAVKIQRWWKQPTLSQQQRESEAEERCDEAKLSTTTSLEARISTLSPSPPTPALPPKPSSFPTPTPSPTPTQPTPTSTVPDVAPASALASSLTTASSKQIIFGRPDTFGAAGMGIPTMDDSDSYYMPNVKERAKALSYWKLTKKEKSGHQRALEWKRSCCRDDGNHGAGGGDGNGDGGGSIVNIQAWRGASLSYTNNGSGERSQVDGHSRDQEDNAGLCSGDSSDSASLAAALTMKKATTPCFLAKFVQLLEDDVNDNGGGDKQQTENAMKKQNSKRTKKAGVSPHSSGTCIDEQDHENTVNGGISLTPRGSGAPSPRMNRIVLSPRAALSPRNGLVSTSNTSSASTFAAASSTTNSQSPKITTISMSGKSKKNSHFPSNIRVTKNISRKLIPQSPCNHLNGEPSRSMKSAAAIGRICKDKNGEHHDLRGHTELASDDIKWGVKGEAEEKSNHWYGTHRDDDVDYEDKIRMKEVDEDVDDDEIAAATLATDNQRVEVYETPSEITELECNGEKKAIDSLLVESMTMNSTDSIIEEAMNFLNTPLFDTNYPTKNHPEHSNDDEGPQQEQFIKDEEELCEGELLEVAERFALSLDRFLVGVDDAVKNDVRLHVNTTKDRAQKQRLEERVNDKLFIGELSDELQIDPCDWIGWVETPRHVDGGFHSSSFPVDFSCGESGRSFSRIASESLLDFDEDGFGAFEVSLPRHTERDDAFFPSIDQSKSTDMTRRSKVANPVMALNTSGHDDTRKSSKIKICIDGAPDFINVNSHSKSLDEETTFFVASQPSPSCGDNTCLLVGQNSFGSPASTAATGQGSATGKQSGRKINLKRFLSSNVKSVTPSSLFGQLIDDDGSASNDSSRIDKCSTIVSREQVTETTEGNNSVFASTSTESFFNATSPQNGSIADFDSKSRCNVGSISSSSEVTDSNAPALAVKAKKMLKRITPFSGKSRKMLAFGSLDDAEVDQSMSYL